MPPNTIYVGRPTKWGNPFHAPTPAHKRGAVAWFVRWVEDKVILTENGKPIPACHFTKDDIKRELAGKDLACWCKEGEACHADVLLKIANEVTP